MTWLLLLIISIIVWLNRGLYDPSVPGLTVVFLFWVWYQTTNRKDAKILTWIGVGLPWLWSLLFVFKNDLLYVSDEYKGLPLRLMTFAPFVGLCVFTFIKNRARYLGLFLLVIPFFLTLFLSKEPHIDVFLSNREGVKYLLQGLNPYSQTYQNIYSGTFDYTPGYLYWPGALYLQAISHLICGDIRVVLVLAWLGSLFFLPDWKKYASLWFTIPVLAFTFEQAWLDPLIVLGAAMALYGLKRERMIFFIAGSILAMSVKQYGFMIGLFGLIYLWRTTSFQKIVKPAFLIGVGTLLVLSPFLIWSCSDFLQMTLFSHATAPVRADALNFTAFWLKQTGEAFSPLVQLLSVATGFGLACFHVYRNGKTKGLSIVAESWTIFFGFSIFFGKFAFCNYFVLLMSFLILSERYKNDKEVRADFLPR